MLKNFDKTKTKIDGIKTIPSIFQVLVICLSFIVIIFQFASYIYDMQWFNYWGIDKSFYTQNSIDIINNLIYSVCILLILAFFSIEVYKCINDDYYSFFHWLKIIFCYILSWILLTPSLFYKENFNINYFISNIIGSMVTFFLIIFYIKKLNKLINKFKDSDYTFMLYKEFFHNLLIIFVAVFISTIILGNINVTLNKKYRIIDNEASYVVLYSQSDYYIVANCEIKNDELVIFRNTVKKIDNYNIIYEWRNFGKIIKE